MISEKEVFQEIYDGMKKQGKLVHAYFWKPTDNCGCAVGQLIPTHIRRTWQPHNHGWAFFFLHRKELRPHRELLETIVCYNDQSSSFEEFMQKLVQYATHKGHNLKL